MLTVPMRLFTNSSLRCCYAKGHARLVVQISKRIKKATMKKVLFVTHVGNPGGAEYKMMHFCEAVGESGMIMHLQPGPIEQIIARRKLPSRVISLPESITGIKRSDGPLKILRAVPDIVAMLSSLARVARQYDVICCMSQKSFILFSLIKPFMRRPIIWFMNDILTDGHFSRTMIFALVTLSRFTADRIVLNSQPSFEAWKKAGGRMSGVDIVYPGVDTDIFERAASDKDSIAAYRTEFAKNGGRLAAIVGRISPWKGQDVFLRGCAAIPDLSMVVVGGAQFGEQNYDASLKKLVDDLGIKDRVTFTGHREDVPQIMAACDVIVHASTLPEPFGQVIVQAGAVCVPVIASQGGGAGEIVIHGETGLLTPPGDAPALTAAITKILTDTAQADKIRVNARARVQDLYTKDRMNKKFIDILSGV